MTAPIVNGRRKYTKRDLGVSQKDDAAAYLREYRKANQDYRKRNRLLASARSAAQGRIAQRYPNLFETYYAEEIAKREAAAHE